MSVSFSPTSPSHARADNSSLQTTNIGALLLEAVRQHPHATIGFSKGSDADTDVLSPADLFHEAQSLLTGLRARGCLPGAKIVLLLEVTRDFLPAWWACVLGGYVPCPLTPVRNDPARWAKQLAHMEKLLDHPLLVTTPGLPGNPAGMDAVSIDDLRGEPSALSWYYDAAPSEPAAFMLTSGSTGNSKAVVLTHGNLLASMAGKRQRQKLTSADIALNWISFDHVAALLEIHLVSLYVGAAQFHIDPGAILADPLLFLRLIDRHRISLTFSPNFLLGQINLALQAPGQGLSTLDLSCVRHIISGGEANLVGTGQRFLQLSARQGLAHTALRPAFGMTETCGGSIYSDAFPECDAEREFASVGQPVSGLQMRIVAEDGTAAPAGAAGELQLRGDMIFSCYHNDAAATRAAFTADGWFRTGDLGRIDQGRLSLAGRSKDSIIVSGVNYFSHELEAAIEPLEGIERSFVAVFPTRPAGADTEDLVVAFAASLPPEEEASLHRLAVAVRNTTIALWGFRPALILPLPRECFPKTSLGKIQRSLLRKRLESGELAAHIEHILHVTLTQLGPHVEPQGAAEQAVADTFGQVLGVDPNSIGATVSFFDFGGTSLDIFKLKRALETRFNLSDVPVVTILQNSTVRALAQRMAAPADSHYNPLVPLQRTGRKTPLFCIHPGTGEILGLVSLAQYFTDDRPFFALRARGFNPGERYFDSFDEMVKCYATAIRECQPQGPYAVAGYSFGAAAAFAVAKVLEAQGEQVAFIGSIDGTPSIGDPLNPLDFIGSTIIVAFFLGLIDKQQMLDMPARIRACGADVCAVVLAAAPKGRAAELNLDLAKLRAWADLAFSLVKIGEAYEPTSTVDSATVFYAEPLHGSKHEWLQRHLRRWDGFTRSPNRYVEVSGEHNSLLGPRHVAAFQATLRAELDRALQE